MSQLPETVSTSDFADMLGLTSRRIQQLISDGVLTSAGHGKLTLRVNLKAFVDWKAESELRTFRSSLEARQARNQDELDLDAERTRKLRLENDETENKLIAVSLLDDALDLLAGPLLVDLTSLPARLTDDVPLRRRIESEIDSIRKRHVARLRRAVEDIRDGADPLEAEPDEEEIKP